LTPRENRALIRRLFEETAGGDLSILDRLVRPTAIFHSWACPDAGLSPAIGPGGQRERLTMFRAAFPDSKFTIGALGARADFVVLRWTATGTHLGVLLGVHPTGKRVTRRGTAIYCLVDGRIAEEWGHFDLRGLLRQLAYDGPPRTVEAAVGAAVGA
jgi:predicted ester cyclase